MPWETGILTERGKQTMRHENKTQDEVAPKRRGLVDCLFARL